MFRNCKKADVARRQMLVWIIVVRLKIKKEPDHVEPSRQGNKYRFMLKCNGKPVKGLKRRLKERVT